MKKTVLYLLPAGRQVIVKPFMSKSLMIYLSFSELMPILLNVLIGVPQMLSNIQ